MDRRKDIRTRKRIIEHMHLKQVRRDLARLQNWRCFYCASKLDEFTVTYDHIQLSSEGGVVSLDNGVVSCSACNWLRDDIPFKQFCEDMNITMKRPRHKSDRFKFLCTLTD